MFKIKTICLLAGSIFIASLALAQDDQWDVKWHNGFKFESPDKMFKLKFGGRLMYDYAFFFQDTSLESQFGKLNNGTEFRRARFYSAGTVYNNVNYKLQLDFAGGKITFKDAYIGISHIPGIGNFRVGHFKEPFRLEAVTSSKYITFMERATPIDFLPERNNGVMIFNEHLDGRLSWQAGLFRSADGAGNDKMANKGYSLTGRITGLPITSEDKRKLLHIGAAFSYRKPQSKTFAVASKPESHLGLDYINTGDIMAVKEVKLMEGEAALVLGSFSLQGEVVQAMVSTKNDTNPNNSFAAYYAQISYFLTGENRVYKESYEGFDRVSPKKNFGKDKGCGAWEIALRYSNSYLNSHNIQGGELGDITLGLNWYLNPSMRIMANYVYANLKDVGQAGIVQTRFSWIFKETLIIR